MCDGDFQSQQKGAVANSPNGSTAPLLTGSLSPLHPSALDSASSQDEAAVRQSLQAIITQTDANGVQQIPGAAVENGDIQSSLGIQPINYAKVGLINASVSRYSLFYFLLPKHSLRVEKERKSKGATKTFQITLIQKFCFKYLRIFLSTNVFRKSFSEDYG